MKFSGVLPLFFTISFFCVHLSLKAATFTVVSNADSGPGTLREAITRANSNGTTIKDYIYFNLPGVQLADVTITLNSDLPALSSNITVDASTQGSPLLGVSGARVLLYRQTPTNATTYYALKIESAQQVEIYSLAIKTAVSTIDGYGIWINGACSDIKIGTAGKGNIINGYKFGIYGFSNFNPQPISNLTIQSNIIGYEEDGKTLTEQLSCFEPVLIHHLNGALIGGNRTDLGNLMMGYTYGVSLVCDAGDMVVSFNKVGVDVTGTIGTDLVNIFRDEMLGVGGTTTGKVTVSDNQVAGTSIHGIGVFGMQNGTFSVVRNKIGTEITGTTLLGQRSSGILVRGCNVGMIGGSMADKNIIAGCYDAPVTLVSSYRVTVSQNEMFCNNASNMQEGAASSIQLLSWYPQDGKPMPFVHVLSCNASTLSGEAPPNAKMEAFIPYRCSPGVKCDGRNYIETFFAGADGKWTYALKGRDGVIISATDATGATSDYSNPVWSDDMEYNITHTACGKNTGGIKNKILYNALPFHWEDEAGNIVSTDTSLTNVAPGRYRLVAYGAGCNKPECREYSHFYEVKDMSPAINTINVAMAPATCGLNNGSIGGLQFEGINLKYAWRNAANVIVGTGPTLMDLAPGMYTLTITDSVNSCTALAGPFEIKSVTAPTLNVSGVVLRNANCSQPTGSITGLTVTGSGTISYTWTNENGIVVGNALDLLNVPAGQYILSFTDGSPCPPAPSAPFVITAPGLITIDQSAMVIRQSDCTVDNGGVTGLQATNAETIRWLDNTGAIVGNGIDLSNVKPGTYTLQISNSLGCTATADFIIPRRSPVPIIVAQINEQDPVCNLQNGSITGLVLTGGTPLSYRWIDVNGTQISTEKDIRDLGDGTYRLYITDTDLCEQLVRTVTLKTPNLPVVSTQHISIIDDICNMTSGMIAGLTVTGKDPLTYAWLNQDSATISTSLQAQGLPGGVYTLQVTDGYGCKIFSPPFLIDDVDILLLAPAAKDVMIMKGMTAEIKVTNLHQGTYYLFKPNSEFSQTSTTGEFSLPGITESTTFGLNYVFGDCVSPTTYVRVELINTIRIVGPTAFSPNGDGRNDLFKPKGFGVASYTTFVVMDRWGNMLFSTKDIEKGWDGTYQGKKVEAGSYVWMIQGIDILGQPVQGKGAVTVIY